MKRDTEWNEIFKCKCRLDASVCNNDGMMINAGVNAKNWLIKVYEIEGLFGILVIVSECNKSCDVGEYLDYESCKCRKKLVNKLIEKCTENIDEVKNANPFKIYKNAVLSHCTLCYFQ